MLAARRLVSLLTLAAALAAAGGCATQDPSAQADHRSMVAAVFDPEKSDVPSPNDLATTNGVVAIPHNPFASETDNELFGTMNGRDGFSAGSAGRVRFTGAISARTLTADTVITLDLGERGRGPAKPVAMRLEYTECDHALGVVAPVGLEPGHTYLVALRGGSRGIKDPNGRPVEASPVFHFLRSGVDLREHADAFPGSDPEVRKSLADQLETVRRGMTPLFELLERRETVCLGREADQACQPLPRADLLVLFSFTVQSDPEIWFDPGSKRLPMPNDLVRDSKQGRVAVPIDPTERPQVQELMRGFNTLDGFSTSGALSFDTNSAIDPASVVVGRTVRLLREDTLEEKKDLAVSLTLEGKRLLLEPRTPLAPATRYVAVVAGLRDTKGRAFVAMPLGSLLKLRKPIFADGKSQVGVLCTPVAEQVEEQRSRLAPLLAKLEAAGVRREQVAAAFAFTTLTVDKDLEALYRAPYESNLPLTVRSERKSPMQRGLVAGLGSVAQIITGSMTTLDHLDPKTHAFRASGVGQPRSIEFLFTLPEGLKPGQAVPVAIFGHGLMTERRVGLFLANRLAERGFAMMAIDLPLHGERSICVDPPPPMLPGQEQGFAHCKDGHHCSAEGVCVDSSGKPQDLRRADVFGLGSFVTGTLMDLGKMPPISTGGAFIDAAHLFSTRDHMRQAVVDLSAQIRLLRRMDWRAVTGGFPVAADRLYFVGISLGGILGANLAVVDPYLRGLLLNCSGADLPGLMLESRLFGGVVNDGLNREGMPKGSPDRIAFINAAKWVLDDVDPINLGAFVRRVKRPIVDPETHQTVARPARGLRMQVVDGDWIIPDSSAIDLARALGIDSAFELRQFSGATHAVLVDGFEPRHDEAVVDMTSFFEKLDAPWRQP